MTEQQETAVLAIRKLQENKTSTCIDKELEAGVEEFSQVRKSCGDAA